MFFLTRLSLLNRCELLSFFKILRRFSRRIHSRSSYSPADRDANSFKQIGKSCNKKPRAKKDKCLFRDVSQELKEICGIFHKNIFSSHSLHTLVDAYIHGRHAPLIEVPFTCVLDLVAKRRVSLKAGRAFLPASELGHLLSTLFFRTMNDVFKAVRISENVILLDARMRHLVYDLQRIYYMRTKPTSADCLPLSTLSHRDIASQADAFPPCMSAIYRELVSRRKVPHNDRIKLTLFLKDAGLAIEENLAFWEQFSIREFRSERIATHPRESDSDRYAYSIHHLYGFRGRMVNYKSHGCCYIQTNTGNTGDVGGCIFAENQGDVRRFLRSETIAESHQGDVVALAMGCDYTSACAKFLIAKTEIMNGSRKRNNTFMKLDKTRCVNEDCCSRGCKRARLAAANETECCEIREYNSSQDVADCKAHRVMQECDKCEEKASNLTGTSETTLPFVRYAADKGNNDRMDCDTRSKLANDVSGKKDNCGCNKAGKAECSNTALSSEPDETGVVINKPVDYYRSFLQLLTGLSLK